MQDLKIQKDTGSNNNGKRALALNITKNHLLYVCIVITFLDNLDCIETMQKYLMFIHKMELGSGSH